MKVSTLQTQLHRNCANPPNSPHCATNPKLKVHHAVNNDLTVTFWHRDVSILVLNTVVLNRPLSKLGRNGMVVSIPAKSLVAALYKFILKTHSVAHLVSSVAASPCSDDDDSNVFMDA